MTSRPVLVASRRHGLAHPVTVVAITVVASLVATPMAAAGLAAPGGEGGPAPLTLAPVSQVADSVEAPFGSVHPEAREAISSLWSPYCPGLMLEVCPSPSAAVLRDSIDVLARTGLSSDAIVDRVAAEYGERYRALPPRMGFGGLAWLVPPVTLLTGLVAVGLFLARRRKRTSRPTGVPDRPLDEADRARLDAAMRDLDASEAPDF